MTPKEILVLSGVRRSGKSYIMRQVIKELIKKGIKKDNILLINFEDKRFAEFYLELLDEIYEVYLEFLKPNDEIFVLLDEVHNVPRWEKWARTMHELKKVKIIVSGSSSKLLPPDLNALKPTATAVIPRLVAKTLALPVPGCLLISVM